MYNLSRSVFRAGKKASWALVISACLGQVQLAWANNPQIAGSGMLVSHHERDVIQRSN